MELLPTVLPAILSAGGAWGAVWVHLRWLRADISRLERRVERLEERVRGYGTFAPTSARHAR